MKVNGTICRTHDLRGFVDEGQYEELHSQNYQQPNGDKLNKTCNKCYSVGRLSL